MARAISQNYNLKIPRILKLYNLNRMAHYADTYLVISAGSLTGLEDKINRNKIGKGDYIGGIYHHGAEYMQAVLVNPAHVRSPKTTPRSPVRSATASKRQTVVLNGRKRKARKTRRH